MNAYIEYLFITAIVVYIVDLSGFTQSWKGLMGRWLKGAPRSIKPFDCSLCMTWWTLLFISHIQGTISPAMCAYIAALSFMSDIIGQVVMLIKETIKMALRHLFNITQL